ncbi:NUDIX hydrolase [Terriglobus aquaticus]|uniref:GDP-mannose pyrophosphatase n=1 Tax=Terriglobus aquaticus TaxID=940139 RepID=A0ABW9KKR1_9BACT|nr:NUDIX hydrolase [Terriglobus aquaticus]
MSSSETPAAHPTQTAHGAAASSQMPDLPVVAPELREGKAEILSSHESFHGKIFSVYTEEVLEPNGVRATRDVVRHNGSVVVLAVDETTDPSDPLIVLEQQFRHAANQYLFELPAGRVDPGETTRHAAERELIEETGYRATQWETLVKYYASPGFVAEWMEIYLATGITTGEAQPEEDEKIDTYLVPLSRVLRMIDEGRIHDGKTLIGVMLYARRHAARQG